MTIRPLHMPHFGQRMLIVRTAQTNGEMDAIEQDKALADTCMPLLRIAEDSPDEFILMHVNPEKEAEFKETLEEGRQKGKIEYFLIPDNIMDAGKLIDMLKQQTSKIIQKTANHFARTYEEMLPGQVNPDYIPQNTYYG